LAAAAVLTSPAHYNTALGPAPPSAQDDTKPYFSLSSGKTYGPGDKATIAMWSQNVDALEFRVYRVKDPILFFQKLEDVHRMSTSNAPRKAKQLTVIERLHHMKVSARNAVRDGFRAQYTPDTRVAIRNWISPEKAKPTPIPTSFSGLPLLNSQQLVTVWRQNVAQHKQRWESENIPIPVTDKGLYLVEAAHDALRAYTVVIVTDITLVTKTAPGRMLTFVAERGTSAPVADCPLTLWSNKQEVANVRTDASGLADIKLNEEHPESTLVLARRGPDFAIDTFSAYNLSSDPSRSLAAGRHMIYFAMGGVAWAIGETGGTWTAISRLPSLQATALWGQGDTHYGRGMFTSRGLSSL
jgi:hypothetical protein